MKVIGQSTLADGSPYVHLGYIASTTFTPDKPLAGGGLVAVCLGLLVGFSFTAGKTKSGWTSYTVARRQRRALVVGGITLIMAGIVALAVGIARGQRVPDYPVEMTRVRFYLILRQIAVRKVKGETLPANMAEAKRMFDSGKMAMDAWSQDMRLVRVQVNGEVDYRVVSAGRDGVFGTKDDLEMSMMDEKLEERARAMLEVETGPTTRAAGAATSQRAAPSH